MRAIFYTKNFNKTIKEKVDVILSPEFYWIKKLDMNVSLREAKKISKNIFKLNEKDYLFDAFKINNKLFVVALKKDLNVKIEKKYINSIRLAQFEFYSYDCIDIGEFIMKKIDDIFFCFPKKNEECIYVDEILENIKLSKNTFNIFNKINIDKNILFYLISSLMILNIFFFIQGFAYSTKLNNLKKIKLSLRKYNMPLTIYQLNSIYNVLKEENMKNNSIRKVLEFLSLNFRNFEFKRIEFNKDVFTVVIKTDKNLDNYFKQFHIHILNSKLENKNYIVKFKYE